MEGSATVAVVGHRSCGKTTLVEALLAAAHVVRERGSVDEGTTLLDHEPTARRLRQTTELSTAWAEWGGRLVQVLDTPGAASLAAMRDLALHSVEAAVVCVDAAVGPEVGTDEAADVIRAVGLPVIAVATRADRGVDPDVPAALAARLGGRAVWLHRPVLEDGALVGLLDVLGRRVLRFATDGAWSPEPVPEGLRATLDLAWEAVSEAVAVTDDALLEHYLEHFELPPTVLREGLHRAVRSRAIVPVLLSAAARGIGADPVLDAIVEWVPTLRDVPREVVDHEGGRERLEPDGPFVARVLGEHVDADGHPWHLLRVLAGCPSGDWFTARTGDRHRVRKLYRIRGPRRAAAHDVGAGAILGTWDELAVTAGATLTAGAPTELFGFAPAAPMVAWHLRPERPSDTARLDAALMAACRRDPGLALHTDTLTGAVLLAGADDGHLRVVVERLREAGLPVSVGLPPVGYVETPRMPVSGVEGLHVKTDADGLVEEYGRCEVALSTVDPLDGNLFVDGLGDEEDDLPARYRPAIDQGLREALQRGPTAGFPVIGCEVVLTGGAYDLLQSTEDHFRLAGQRAARAALERSGTRILEPWWEIEVSGPARVLGDVLSDIASHRGRVLGTEVDGEQAVVTAHCPYRELRTFGARLRSLSHGRARFRARESHFEAVPQNLVPEVVAAARAERG